jgi:hypothetical protein
LTGRIVFVLGNDSFAAGYRAVGWAYLGRGFKAKYDQAALVNP